MEINGLGLINMDEYRRSSLSASSDPQKFESLLRKTYGTEPGTDMHTGNRTENRTDILNHNEPIDKTDKLYNLCLELETFLVKNLLTGMRNTVQKSGLIEEGFAGKMYEDMLYDEYAKDLTKNAGFGLAEQAYRQLKRLQ